MRSDAAELGVDRLRLAARLLTASLMVPQFRLRAEGGLTSSMAVTCPVFTV